MNRRTLLVVAIVGVISLGVGTTWAAAVGEPLGFLNLQTGSTTGFGFTYQGRLTDGGAAANGVYDFQFAARNDPSSVKQESETVVIQNVQVTDGLFTVLLDFTQDTASRGLRWLEIGVRPGDQTGDFATLEPLQPITSVPHAVRADTAQSASTANTANKLKNAASVDSQGNLRINGQIKITGGAPGVDKVLVSDSEGLASWKPAPAGGQIPTQPSDSLMIGNPFPAELDETAELEIAGISLGEDETVLVISGPGVIIERVEGFAANRPDDIQGLSQELPFIFEYDGDGEQALQDAFDDDPVSGQTRPLALYVNHAVAPGPSARAFFWTTQGSWRITEIQTGSNGRKRYTMENLDGPDHKLDLVRDITFESEASKNPATDDRRVEISGVDVGGYPSIISIDESDRTITFVFDYNEAGLLWDWVQDNVTKGSLNGKQSMAIHVEDPNIPPGPDGYGTTISTELFHGVFPIQYQQSGFGQFEKIKERVVLSYDYSEDG